MGDVAAKIKIMPKSIDTNLSELKEKITNNLPHGSSIYGNFEIEPIAFGLKALVVTILVNDDEGGIENVEQSIMKIEDAESIQILELGRV